MAKIKMRVVVRQWPDGETIALFPDFGDRRRYMTESYMFIGQHGDADYQAVIESTKPATQEQTDGMLHHLKFLQGYEDFELIPRKRASINWDKVQA